MDEEYKVPVFWSIKKIPLEFESVDDILEPGDIDLSFDSHLIVSKIGNNFFIDIKLMSWETYEIGDDYILIFSTSFCGSQGYEKLYYRLCLRIKKSSISQVGVRDTKEVDDCSMKILTKKRSTHHISLPRGSQDFKTLNMKIFESGRLTKAAK